MKSNFKAYLPRWKKVHGEPGHLPDFPVRRDWVVLAVSFIVLVIVGAFLAWTMLIRLWADTASESPTSAERFEALRTAEFDSFIRTYDTKRQKFLNGE
ncbi:MAG: hypothetical protein V4674_04380 [Patescibacteria group bacterium]